MQMYKTLRSTGNLNFNEIEGRYEAAQEKWPEAIWGEDAKAKYTDPLINPKPGKEPTAFYLPMWQGSKEQQRKYWLERRFAYMDSKWNAGDALGQVIQLRGYAKANITVTPYIDLYVSVKYGSYLEQVRGQAGQAYELACPIDTLNDTEIYIYSAPWISKVGDLSGLKVGVADFSQAVNIQEIKLGDASSSYSNSNMKSLSFGSNKLLKKVDVRNCVGLGTQEQKFVDMSNCEVLEEAYFEGTSIQGLTLPNGGVLKKLHLPSTITNITILNQKNITEFTCASYANVSTLRLENNSSAVDTKTIVQAIPAGARLRLIGIDWTCADTDEIDDLVDVFDTMRGLDDSGNNVDTAQISGVIHVNAATGAQVAAWNAKYPYITFDVANITSYLTFKTWDGGTTVDTVTCYNGVMQGDAPSVPTRSQTAQYNFTAVGWNRDMDASTNDASCLTNVIGDRTVYAAYSRAVRSYTITFVKAQDDGGGTLQTRTLDYGTMAAYTGSTPTTTKGSATDYPFEGWTPALATVTGAATYTAKFGSPVEVAEISDSWDTILANIDNGTYADVYKIGNYKPLDLGTEGVVNMQIVAFDADEDENGNTIPITFISKECMSTLYAYSTYVTSATAWRDHYFRSHLNNNIISKIPSAVRSRVVASKRYTRDWVNGSNVQNDLTIDKLWIPSYREAAGGNFSETNGCTYDKIYSDAESRIKNTVGTSTATKWLIRSYQTGSSSANGTYQVDTDGYFKALSTNTISVRIPLCFCLGKEQPTITDSWDDIFTAESNGTYNTKYSVGDTKELDLGTEGKVLMQIAAFDTDDIAGGNGKAKITWIARQTLATTRKMNNGNTVYNGWASSGMRGYLSDDFYNRVLPSNVKNSVLSVKKYSKTDSSVEGLTHDRVWIPSLKELNTSGEETGVAYSGIFDNQSSSRIRHAQSGAPFAYWTRTVKSADPAQYHYVTDNGSAYYGGSPVTTYGVIIGFCT